MTILISAFGVAGRFAGDLLMTALGWASSLLFGRVPRTHQVFVVLMMALSFLWIVAVVALLVPTVASTLLATTPHPPFVDNQWFGFAVLLSVILLPLCVGAAGYLVPAEGERPGGVVILREILRGYLLAPVISGLLIFLAGVGIARKIRSRRHGWSDAHVAIVVKPGGYDQLVIDVQNARASADLSVTAENAPWVLTLPARILTRVSGSSVRKLRPDRLVALAALACIGAVTWALLRQQDVPEVQRTGVQIVERSRLQSGKNLLPTVSNYQIVANRSLERLDELLTLQGNVKINSSESYTASILYKKNLAD